MWTVIIEYPSLDDKEQAELHAWLQQVKKAGGSWRVEVPQSDSPIVTPPHISAVTEADLDALEQRWLASAK